MACFSRSVLHHLPCWPASRSCWSLGLSAVCLPLAPELGVTRDSCGCQPSCRGKGQDQKDAPAYSYLLQNCEGLSGTHAAASDLLLTPLLQEVGESGTDWVMFMCFFFLSGNPGVKPGTLLTLGKCAATDLHPQDPIL